MKKNRGIKILVAFLVVALFLIIGFVMLKGDKEVSYDTVVAKKENLTQEISETGRIKPIQFVDLSFEMAGKISLVNVKVGDRVEKGQELVSVDNSTILIQIGAAKLAVERAILAEQEGRRKSNNLSSKEKQSLKKASEQARYDLRGFYSSNKKTTLISPISGIVTVQNAKVGETIAAHAIVVSVISESQYEIEAQIVEADISNLNVGDKATFTLDTYGEDEIFKAEVIKIDPAAQLIEGVANYKVILKLDDGEGRVNSGMTADIDIITAERENVIVLSQRAVIYKGGTKMVRILEKGNLIKEVEVETGITGEGGLIEITSGVKEGDTIVTAINE